MADEQGTAPNPMVVQNQNDSVRIISAVGAVISPLILAYIAAVGGVGSKDPKDQFTTVVAGAIADGEYDLARRLIDAVDPPKADENGGAK